MNPRQMGGNGAAIGAALVGASASRRLILFVVVGFAGRNGLLDILKRQGDIETIATKTEPLTRAAIAEAA